MRGLRLLDVKDSEVVYDVHGLLIERYRTVEDAWTPNRTHLRHIDSQQPSLRGRFILVGLRLARRGEQGASWKSATPSALAAGPALTVD